MSWKYGTSDGKIEIIVDPDFSGHLLALANVRPVWIVDTEQNAKKINGAWSAGENMSLYEVSRCGADDANDRIGNLDMIFGMLDDHYVSFDIVVHGLRADPPVLTAIVERGFRVVENIPDGFVALGIPEVRNRILGRA